MSKLINKYIIILLGFYVIWLGILPQVLNNAVTVICRNISHNSDYTITVEKPAFYMSILPTVKFTAENIKIQSKKNLFNTNIDDFKIKIRILPLLSGKLHINNMRMESIIALSDMNYDIELDKDFFNNLGKTKVEFDSLTAHKFDLILKEKTKKTPIRYYGEDFCFKNRNRYISLKLKSNLCMDNKSSAADFDLFLPQNGNVEKTSFDINIANLDISPFKIYFKHYLPKDLQELQGVISITASENKLLTEFKNFAIIMNDSAKSIILPDNTIISSKFYITKKSLYFENTNIESKNLHLFINGKVEDYIGKTMPTLDLNIHINKSKVEDFVKLLPPLEVEDINLYKLKKYKFYGDTLANISIKGRFPEPDITGDIFINNGILTKPIPNASSGATIKIKLTGKYANYDVIVPAGGTEKVWVNGGVELYNIKYSDLSVKSSKAVPLLSAEEVVNPLHEILNFIIGPVPILHIPEGTGNIDITVKGNRKNPHVWGDLNFNNASVKFKEIPDIVLKNADATLTFNDQNAVFTTKKGTVNNQEFKINGICDLSGKFDFNVLSTNQPSQDLYKALQTATLVPDIQQFVPKLDKISGLIDLNIKVYGFVKFIEDLKFNQNAFAKGDILLKDNNIYIQGVQVDNINGKIRFDSNNADTEINAQISNAPMNIKAKVKNDLGDISVNIPKINPNFIIPDKEISAKQYLPFVSVSAKYKGNINNIEYNKLNLNSKIVQSGKSNTILFNSGEFNILNGKIFIKNLKGCIENNNNPFNVDLRVNDAFTQNPIYNGSIWLKTPDICVFNEFLSSSIIPDKFRKYTHNCEFKNGSMTVNIRLNDNKVNADSELNNITLNYLPADMPISIINGNISAKNSIVKLDKINLLADNMPILADGEIRNILSKQDFDIYINSKPQQEFIDKYINKNRIYPIKIKGDIVYWAKLRGNKQGFDLKSKVDMSKESSIYYLGATVGDLENAISVYIDSKFSGKSIRIKEFSYDKMIDSQSGKQTRFNLLKVWGGVDLLQDDLLFKDLHIKTSRPTDARIFNIIFRKPNIKQGQFTSDLKINNKLSSPRVLGEFHLFETNIPFIDINFKNIELIFKDRVIEISSKGDIVGNDVKFEGILKNKLSVPYHIESATLYTKDLNLNKITTKLKTVQIEPSSNISPSENFNIDILTANNLKLVADTIELRNIYATNFESQLSISEKGLFDVSNFKFNIANGQLEGSYKYNLKTSDAQLSIDAKSISANDIVWALFDLDNQIYGELTGKTELSCNGEDFNKCLASLNGTTIFNVKDGKMPKLGSLEYLLKAGNLVKGGITGLSINSVIDIITPLKTGEFSNIFGSINIKDGVADDIEITTKGKDLSLFISGNYNFATSIANMEVLGLLSRKISNMLGPVGNISINTLFSVIPGIDLNKDSPVIDRINKIPGIEISNKNYRKFLAEIKGDIKGENYVTTFSWIN